jgi:hypothetical protein
MAFMNDGAGHFSARELPLEAQLMASYGVILEDLDTDGHLDAYLVGNFDGPTEVRVGPYTGGVSVWLRGDGAGGFESVPPARSGLSIPEDSKGLAAADFDGDMDVDLAVGLNDAPLKVFRNAPAEAVTGLSVRLVGDAGNPHGVGARVTVTPDAGPVQVREVQSGASFLSQSSPVLVFGLGPATSARITVTWPDGSSTEVANAAAGQLHTLAKAGG